MPRNGDAVRERRVKLEWFWKALVQVRPIASAPIASTTRVEGTLVFRPNTADRGRNRSQIDIFRYSPECFCIKASIRSAPNL
jgi:hypothetical protein